MPILVSLARSALLALSASLALLACQAVRADMMLPRDTQNQPAKPLPEPVVPANTTPLFKGLSASGMTATDALSRGRWTNACNIATSVLARQEPDIDALGVFALCAAVRNDRVAASSALDRLRQVEAAPYYSLLAEGILYLRDKLPDKAETAFKTVLQTRPSDPLGLYFSGEALHALHKDAEAISTFKSVLKSWPDFAPALTAAARLMATPNNAARKDLNAAITMTERATSIEPMNLAYWKLLVELYNRTGQHDRANAITLQWLNPPRAK